MDKTLSKVLVKYGIEQQSLSAVNVLLSLIKEITKAMCDQLDKENLTEAMADVKIVIEQMKIYYSISDSDIDKVVQQKIKRLDERMNNGRNS